MKDHELKCWPDYFQAMLEDRKHFEIRKNDRSFRVGDTLFLKEFNINKASYTGRRMRVLVHRLWVGLPGLDEGFCIMEISIIQPPWVVQLVEKPPQEQRQKGGYDEYNRF